MGNEDVRDLLPAQTEAPERDLRRLAAVEQEQITLAAHQHRREARPGSGIMPPVPRINTSMFMAIYGAHRPLQRRRAPPEYTDAAIPPTTLIDRSMPLDTDPP